VLFDGGWGLVRASNTQPVLVLRFEAQTPARLKEIQDIVLTKLAEISSVKVPR
jgi:phosphomannomutase/phosphoglucomutase